MPRVYILILNYKNWQDVTECLQTLLRSTYDNFTAIIIDNDSQNDSLQQIINWVNINNPVAYTQLSSDVIGRDILPADLPKLVFVQNEQNKGFAAGINTVLQRLIHEDAYTWLLNPDMTIDKAALNEQVHFAVVNPQRSIIGSVIKYHKSPDTVHLYAGGKINFNSATIEMITDKKDIGELDYVSGGSLFTHANSFVELGLLPEDYFLYWEETDFCYRAKKQGYVLLLCDTAICYDKVSTSIGKNFLSDFYYTRNGLLFLSKYKKEKVPVALFLTFFRLLKRMITGRFGRARGMYRGMVSFLKRNDHAHQ